MLIANELSGVYGENQAELNTLSAVSIEFGRYFE